MNCFNQFVKVQQIEMKYCNAHHSQKQLIPPTITNPINGVEWLCEKARVTSQSTVLAQGKSLKILHIQTKVKMTYGVAILLPLE